MAKRNSKGAMTDKIVVLVSCGTEREANRIGKALVERRVAACANIFHSPVKSIYRWKGNVETAKEFLMVVKTSRARFNEIERMVKALHSYDVPEIIALPIATGSRDYLKWISESVGAVRGKKKR